ncbi:Na+-driven exporter or maturation protein [Neobacillus bataviensis LMG 21833]|uniref:Na+-driven exporter or maturation protein n=1 Tax=Neobacillus bataviensis LMG 21833 TaxID=1117379 RepID=K6DDL0_9BACI|nr:ABC transporter permease [Neobacillus bataviensis]EKN66138.1 Na+-driven exporter or maturation protein [Neobacillus bataviensis LMG 21833]
MRKLISLEIKKFKLYSYLKGVLITNFVIMGFLCLIYFGEKSDGNIAFVSYESAFADFGSLIRAAFTIFASVLIARLFIEEYKSKSITLMFMYPIKRKKIMIAKLLIVAGFTFLTIFFSNILVGSAFYLADSFLHFVPKALTAKVLTDGLIAMTLGAIASAGMALIPLFFGMRKKSVPTTIVSAIILVSLTSSTSNDVTVFSFIAIPISLAVIGCLIAYFSIRNIEKVDVN